MRDDNPSFATSGGGTSSLAAGTPGDLAIGVGEFVHALKASRRGGDMRTCREFGGGAATQGSRQAEHPQEPEGSFVQKQDVAPEGLFARAQRLPQPVRFILAGGSAAAINWLIRIPLSTVMPFLPAVLVAACIGMTVGFITYRKFVFLNSARPIHLQIRDFLAVNVVTSLIVAGLSVLFLGVIGSFIMNLMIAQALAHGSAIAVGAVLNYMGHNIVTFAETVRRGLPSA